MKHLLRTQGHLLGLISLMFLIFFGQCLLGREAYLQWMTVPDKIIEAWHHLLTGDFSAIDFRTFSSLLTYAFLHADIEHVTFNMIYFWIFGALLVELLGWRWMLLIFGVTAVGGSLCHVLMNRTSTVPMLGASGALMGFEGAYLALAVRWTLPDPHVWPIASPIPPSRLALLAVLGVTFDYLAIMQGQDTGTAYGAHIGGFTTGLVFAALAAPRPTGRTVRRR